MPACTASCCVPERASSPSFPTTKRIASSRSDARSSTVASRWLRRPRRSPPPTRSNARAGHGAAAAMVRRTSRGRSNAGCSSTTRSSPRHPDRALQHPGQQRLRHPSRPVPPAHGDGEHRLHQGLHRRSDPPPEADRHRRPCARRRRPVGAIRRQLSGAAGWIWGAANVMPHECVQLWNLVQSGDHAGALRLWEQMLPANMFFWENNVDAEYNSAVKTATNMVGRSARDADDPSGSGRIADRSVDPADQRHQSGHALDEKDWLVQMTHNSGVSRATNSGRAGGK